MQNADLKKEFHRNCHSAVSAGENGWAEVKQSNLFCLLWKALTNCGSSVCRLNVSGSHGGDAAPPAALRETAARQSLMVTRLSQGNWFSST